MVLATLPCRHQYHIHTAIIGAGVIGLSVARALSVKGRHEVLLLEQANAIGSGQSSRNSEVIHAGIYYDNSMPLKSRMCVEGRRLLYDYCRERNIPHKQCGKLLVATDIEQQNVGLPQLVELAKRNGVNDIQLVSKGEIADMEPSITCTGGAFSPSTGIIDSHALMTSLLADAEENGATTLALQCNVQGGRIISTTSEERGNISLHVDDSEIACDNVVICAGLASDKIATSIVSNGSTYSTTNEHEVTSNQQHRPIPKQYYAKGNYFKLIHQKSPFTHLIYPLPDPRGAGLGVHATIDMANSIRFGPDVEWLDSAATTVDHPETIDMHVDPTRAEMFYDEIRKYWPDLQGERIKCILITCRRHRILLFLHRDLHPKIRRESRTRLFRHPTETFAS